MGLTKPLQGTGEDRWVTCVNTCLLEAGRDKTAPASVCHLCRCNAELTDSIFSHKPLGIQGPSSLWISAAHGGCGRIQLAFVTVTQGEGGNQETGLSQNNELKLLSPLPDM